MDLNDDETRAGVIARLSGLYAGRPVIIGPGMLAAYAPFVDGFAALGCPVLVVSDRTRRGPVPDESACTVVEIELPPTASMTEEVRLLDRVARTLPPPVVAAIEAFDPERRAVWHTPPFVTTDEPLLGRQVTGGRPASYLALEDKMLADQIWEAAGVTAAPYRIVEPSTGGPGRGQRASSPARSGSSGAATPAAA